MGKQILMVRNERGATFVLFALSLAMLMGMAALAVDLSMLHKARSDAQRAADAAALAGASALIDYSTAPNDTAFARVRARDLATKNTVLNATVTIANADIVPDRIKHQVRVTVRRTGINTWFAKLLGVAAANVSASATAEAIEATGGSSSCVKPFAVPDIWDEKTQDNGPRNFANNRVWDFDISRTAGEIWTYDPGLGDTYKPYIKNDNTSTGYGSAWRDAADKNVTGDYGQKVLIKAQDPKASLEPGFFYPFRMPDSKGGQDYAENIASCAPGISIGGAGYSIEPGNMIGPTADGLSDLLALDPAASWKDGVGNSQGSITGSTYSDPMQSPRVIRVGLFDPALIATIQGAGGGNVIFNNIGLMFIETCTNASGNVRPNCKGGGPAGNVTARFLGFAAGQPGPAGIGTGSLIKVLRLVK